MTPDVGQTAVSTPKEIGRLIYLINVLIKLFIVDILSQSLSTNNFPIVDCHKNSVCHDTCRGRLLWWALLFRSWRFCCLSLWWELNFLQLNTNLSSRQTRWVPAHFTQKTPHLWCLALFQHYHHHLLRHLPLLVVQVWECYFLLTCHTFLPALSVSWIPLIIIQNVPLWLLIISGVY